MAHPVVILIHGTFATGAKWTKPGSIVRRCLKEKLGDDTLFLPFSWSGRNSHRARRQAGAMLAYLLEKHARKDPDAVRFLVAHSHGGNVALYALKNEKTREFVQALASFNTPYISCKRRPVRDYILVLAALVVLLLGGWMVLSDMASSGFDELPIGLIVVTVMVWSPVLGFATWLVKGAKSRQKRIVETISLPANGSRDLNLYCAVNEEGDLIGLKGDLIRLWLDLMEYLSSLGHRLWKLWLFITVGLVGLATTVYVAWGETQDRSVAYVLLLGAVFGLASVLAFVILIEILMLVLPRVFRSHGFGFGWEVPGTNWLVEIKPEDSPPGFPDTVRHNHSTGSWHGHDLYADEKCVMAVAEWIVGRREKGESP